MSVVKSECITSVREGKTFERTDYRNVSSASIGKGDLRSRRLV